MVQFTTPQIFWLLGYLAAFCWLLAMFLHWADSNAGKQKNYVFLYFAFSLILMLVFLAGIWAVIKLFAHYSSAAFCLVTMRFSETKLKYENVKTLKLTDGEAALLTHHMQIAKPVEGFYKHVLVDDNKNMHILDTVHSDLLDYAKEMQRMKPATNYPEDKPPK